MKKIACCFYGNKLPDDTISKICSDLTGENIHVTTFMSYSDDKFKSLESVAHIKRKYEIVNKFDFDICIAIDGITDSIIIPEPIDDNTVYYYSGAFINASTLICPGLFLAVSEIFDRACEFNINLPNINAHWLPLEQQNSSGKFFYHLKSLMIKTKCINYENSSLFIRSTKIN